MQRQARARFSLTVLADVEIPEDSAERVGARRPIDIGVRRQRNLEARAERPLRPQRFGIAVDQASNGRWKSSRLRGAELSPRSILVAHAIKELRKFEPDRGRTRPFINNLSEQHRGLAEIPALA